MTFLHLVATRHQAERTRDTKRDGEGVKCRTRQEPQIEPGPEAAKIVHVVDQLAAHRLDIGVRREVNFQPRAASSNGGDVRINNNSGAVISRPRRTGTYRR